MSTQPGQERLYRMPDGNLLASADAERVLVDALQCGERLLAEAVRQVLLFYIETDQPSRAVAPMERLIRWIDEPATKAQGLLHLGLLRERLHDFAGAAAAYREGLALEPADPELWYWLHNNLGYSLAQLGRHAEAAEYCRLAIAKQPHRHNAYKNLGVALAGQEKGLEAAEALITATRLAPRDRRALQHLDELLATQPAIVSDHPELARAIQQCRNLSRTLFQVASRN